MSRLWAHWRACWKTHSVAAARRILDAASALIILWPLAGYPLTLSLLVRSRRRPSAHDITPLPSLTVIVPTHNEAANIAARLANLAACAYPPELRQVIVVDSGSGDDTAGAVEAFRARSSMPVTLIVEAHRGGKAAAINRALDAATGEIALVTDAPARFEPDTLVTIARCFGDPRVGAATGEFVVTGTPGPVQRAEARFWRVRNRLRTMEARVDSTPFLSGELCAFRRALVRLDEDTLADDVNVALLVRRLGYRAVTCGARVSEPRSNDLRELMETKSRRAAGGVQELLRNRDMAGNPRFGLFGLLILPSALLTYAPLRVPALAVLASTALGALRSASWPVRLLVAGVAVAAALAGGTRGAERAGMLAFNEWIFLQGWRRYLSGRMDVRWQQERSTREPAPVEAGR